MLTIQLQITMNFLLGIWLQTKYTKNKAMQTDEDSFHSQNLSSQYYFKQVESLNPSVL